MILFLEDWKKYPNAMVHTTTTNRSWLELAMKYQKMGIKNHLFHLQLHQPILANVNPHANNLSDEIKLAITLECKINPFYFFREILRLPVGGTGIPFEANRANIAMIWSFLVNIDFILIMPRQCGKSVTGDGLEIWLTTFYYEDTRLIIFTKDNALRGETVERIKATRKLLPSWLNPITKWDADNGENITCKAHNNRIELKVGQSDEQRARALGRGSTSPFVHTEEGPFTINYHISLPLVMRVSGAARENYEKLGLLYGNIHVTTAGQKDTEEGMYCYNFFNSGMFWTEVIFDCPNRAAAHQMVRAGSSEDRLLIYAVFNHRQIGKTDAWLRDRLSVAKDTLDSILRDFFNVWTSGNATHGAIKPELVKIIQDSVKEPEVVKVDDNFILRWYITENEKLSRRNTTHIVAGLDTSNAVGRDANGLVLADIRDLATIGASTVSEGSNLKYAKYIARVLIDNPNMTLVIENKLSGQSIIDIIVSDLLKENINPFTRLYNRIVDNSTTMVSEYDDVKNLLKFPFRVQEQICDKYKKYFGFMTSGNSRDFLFNTVLDEAVNSTGKHVLDQRLSEELSSLIVKNNRVDHPKGGHDDMVFGWLLAQWFIRYSTNLQFYGINRGLCLSLITENGATLTNEEVLRKKKLTDLLEDIDRLKKLLGDSRNVIESIRYETEIAYKVGMAKGYGDTTLNLDTILDSVKDLKNRKANKDSNSKFRFNFYNK